VGKVIKLKELVKELTPLRDTQTIGLITGCFDLLHQGHINFFRFAKENVDILIVGIDLDIAIKKSKGNTRPILTQAERSEVLSELQSVDYVLLLESPHSFRTKAADDYYNKITRLIKPHYLITNKEADTHWETKKKRIESVGGSLFIYERERENSTTHIIERILSLHKL
jgi:rfaE bifunctional protein nucleotidyltransferase chain/domain